MRSLCVSRENIFPKHPLYLITTIKMSLCPLKAGAEISFGKEGDFCCFSGSTLSYRTQKKVKKMLDISERPAEVEVAGTVAPVSVSKGKVERTEDRIVSDEDASGQTQFAEIELIFIIPDISAFD